jgi:tetratricopeptide (TPR) repeat protein
VRYARSYLRDYPEDALAWLWLGIALGELARYEEAEQALAKAIDLCPPEKKAFCLAHMGHMFDSGGDFAQAALWYRRAIAAAPQDATYLIHLGAVLARQGRLHDAEGAHRAATACAEGCIDEAYLNLGFVLRAQERFKEAAGCFREAIRLDPEYRLARRALRDVDRCIKLIEGRA